MSGKEAKNTNQKKVLSVGEHNSIVHAKIREYMEKVVDLKKELKEVSPVKQATLAECNALSRVSLTPQAPAIKLKHPEVISSNSNPLDA